MNAIRHLALVDGEEQSNEAATQAVEKARLIVNRLPTGPYCAQYLTAKVTVEGPYAELAWTEAGTSLEMQEIHLERRTFRSHLLLLSLDELIERVDQN